MSRERAEEPLVVADDLPRRVSSDAEESLAVGVVGIATDAQHAPVLDFDQHPAQGGMAIHRAHRANDHERILAADETSDAEWHTPGLVSTVDDVARISWRTRAPTSLDIPRAILEALVQLQP